MHYSRHGISGGNTRTTAPVFCVLEMPDKETRVHLSLSAVELLEHEVMTALHASMEGSRVSGVLLGRTESGKPGHIVVEGFISLPGEQELGPSPQFSALKSAINEWQPSQGKNLYAVGYCRSSRGESFSPDEEDAALMKDYFPGPASIFLLVKPSLTGNNLGAFFLCENGEIQRDTKLLFPFSRTELAGETDVLPEERQTSAEQHEVEPVRSWPGQFDLKTALSSPLKEIGAALRLRWSRVLSFALLIVIIAGAGYYSLQRSAVQTPKNVPDKKEALALKVDIERHQIRISWDRNSPVILIAKGGRLSIKDGPNTRDSDLDSYLLRTGSLVYSNLTGDVTIRLEVDTADRRVSESVRVIGAEQSAESSWVLPDSSDPRLMRGLTETRPQSATKVPSAITENSADTSGTKKERAQPKRIDPNVELSHSETPVPGDNRQRVGPDLLVSKREGNEPGLLAEGRRSSVALSDSTVAEESSGGTAYIGPRPIHREEPDPSFMLHPFTVPAVQINVRVFIDSGGKVVRAESLSKGNRLMEHLSKIALQAARQWTFAPARRGDQNIPSAATLQFRFVNNRK